MTAFVHFDPRPFLRMIDGDTEAFAQLATLFIEKSGEQIAALEDAVARDDAAALRERAHALKGSLALFHATPALDLCAALEHSAPVPLSDAAPAVAKLGSEIAALCGELDSACRAPEALAGVLE